MIRRRTGWFTTISLSLVVNPTPKNAEYAWKFAVSHDRPVIMSADAPTRTMMSEIAAIMNTEMMAAMHHHSSFGPTYL